MDAIFMGAPGAIFQGGSNQTQRMYPMDRGGNMIGAAWSGCFSRPTAYFPSLRAQRSNPESFREGSLDCFTALAMTGGWIAASPRQQTEAGRLRSRTPPGHHAILPLFCPTEQTNILLFPKPEKAQ
ncbi:hypothetical protein IVA88_31175 [Bradyrhizobium sp. 149]|uniref:hypothetical protein n=1 Tax=Bradyrhizobium sp. 149 TaxID=2782624 RepID=UPI001FFB9B8A|nr:hypothetical protein [Bradyrhizobium sp. 149]MCK1655847.1 hypothetical protein [Bradyrhizobium sp. 149]